jgi:hypothetical protein
MTWLAGQHPDWPRYFIRRDHQSVGDQNVVVEDPVSYEQGLVKAWANQTPAKLQTPLADGCMGDIDTTFK